MQALCHHEVHGGDPRLCVTDLAVDAFEGHGESGVGGNAEIADEAKLAGSADRAGETSGRAGAKEQRFGVLLLDTFLAHRDRIDTLISECLTEWTLDRLAAVERNVLRIGVAELLLGKTRAAVVLDEAVEISQTFSSPAGAALVNGVLDSVRRRLDENATPSRATDSES